MGFGRACAPVRCAHPSSWVHYHAKRGAARPPPPRPSQLHCFLFYPQKYIKSVELGPPTSRAFFFSQEHRGYELWGPPAPRIANRSFADPSGNILGSKLCTGATIRPNFFFGFFFSIVFGSFLFIILFLFYSPFQFLLILLFLFFFLFLLLFFS